MAVNSWLNSAYQDPKGVFWAGEVCDPIEDGQYGYKIGDVLVTDFVTANWFAHEHSQADMDLKGHVTAAFSGCMTGGLRKSSILNPDGCRSPGPKRCAARWPQTP